MIGIILAVVYSAFKMNVAGASMYEVYQPSMNFLFWWYATMGVIVGLCYLVVILSTFAAAFSARKSKVAALIGALVVGIYLVLVYVVMYGSLLYGTYLLQHAWNGETWESSQLLLGLVLFVFGFMLTRVKGSSTDKVEKKPVTFSNSSSNWNSSRPKQSKTLSMARAVLPEFVAEQLAPCPNCGAPRKLTWHKGCEHCGNGMPVEDKALHSH